MCGKPTLSLSGHRALRAAFPAYRAGKRALSLDHRKLSHSAVHTQNNMCNSSVLLNTCVTTHAPNKLKLPVWREIMHKKSAGRIVYDDGVSVCLCVHIVFECPRVLFNSSVERRHSLVFDCECICAWMCGCMFSVEEFCGDTCVGGADV